MQASFTPLESLAGGALIGLSAADMLIVHGRVAGISGMLSGAIMNNEIWRFLFLGGLIAGSVVNFIANPVEEDRRPKLQDMHLARVAIAGVIVGAGTKLGSGCTSGHGVCGLGRFSKRSFAAVGTFMATAAATAFATWRLTHTLVSSPLPPAPPALSSSAPPPAPSFSVAPLRGVHSLFGLKALAGAALSLGASAFLKLPLVNTFFAGTTFGLGLGVSGMAQQTKVIGFLNPLGGHWDPSLAFVMAGAVAVSTASFALYQRRGRRPLLAEQCSLPTKTEVDGHLILGSALFGVGWGLGGFCPGPALANLSAFIVGTANGGGSALALGVFVATMATGMVVTERVLAKLSGKPKPPKEGGKKK